MKAQEVKRDKKSLLIVILLGLLLVVYVAFLYIDLSRTDILRYSDRLKYLAMLMVFAISLLIGKNYISKRDILLLRLALATTLVADFLLLFIKGKHALGVGIFALAQILHNLRYREEFTRNSLYNFSSLLIFLMLIYAVSNRFLGEFDFLITISIFYAIALLAASYRGFQLLKSTTYPKRNSRMILAGMILFILCDVNVLLFNLPKTMNIDNLFLTNYRNISYILMWFFYLPSQVLLVLSGYFYNQE